ncbi:MAG: class I SAM-dependent methyltransferase [Alphaproteobacteria bacterium]|nr:class I SAM-dependent methyltransferase [Alphaproteobacteria bacterium]
MVSLTTEVRTIPAGSRRSALRRWLEKFYRKHLRYPLWRLRHPRAPFHQYYVDLVGGKLARGRSHRALGTDYREAAESYFVGVLRHFGLRPEHVLLDYGCGSLRLGKHAIAYLDPGNYVGLDITDLFFKAGLEVLDPALLSARQPRLAVIGEASPGWLRERPADFVACWHVISKVPERELPDFFRNLLAHMGPRTRALIQVSTGRRREKKGLVSWRAPVESYVEVLRRVAPEMATKVHELPAELTGEGPLTVLEVRRAAG